MTGEPYVLCVQQEFVTNLIRSITAPVSVGLLPLLRPSQASLGSLCSIPKGYVAAAGKQE